MTRMLESIYARWKSIATSCAAGRDICVMPTHQLDELLVAHLPIFVALDQGEQHVQLGRVQLQLMVLHQAGEVLHWNETGVLWVQLEIKNNSELSEFDRQLTETAGQFLLGAVGGDPC